MFYPGDLPLFIPAWVREILPELKGPALSILVAYASHADRKGVAYPSLNTLRRETGYGDVSVKKGRRQLVKRGLLVSQGQSRGSQGQWGRKVFRMGWLLAKPLDSFCPTDIAPRYSEAAERRAYRKGIPLLRESK